MNDLTAHLEEFYIDGAWVRPTSGDTHAVENPATERAEATIALGSVEDVNRAVAAAAKAFVSFGQTPKADRVALLQRVLDGCLRRTEDLARAMTYEMGVPFAFSKEGQVAGAQEVLKVTIEYLKTFEFSTRRGSTRICKEPAGVCALITPWNWPLFQILCQVSPALAAGCTLVLKPSERAPLSGLVFAEIMHEAGVPAGVFNLLNGTGAVVGHAMVGHPAVDAVSFTGSTRAGVSIGREAANTVKRVMLELGGKSPNIILPDADIEKAVRNGVEQCLNNSGQNCNAPTRMLVSEKDLERVTALAKAAAEAHVVGDPWDAATVLGPLANKPQFDKVQRLMQMGVSEGAVLATGGPGRPAGLDTGYYAKPTVFSNVKPHMTIAREEIFGPVLSIIPYKNEEEAIAIANDTVYGLGARVSSADPERARRVAARLRVGSVTINDAPWTCSVPFGGFKQSGHGREYAEYGIDEFVEIKSIVGFE